MIARTLDNKRLSYDGRVYIEITAHDEVVKAAQLVLDTIDAHDIVTETCDRDGRDSCDCLEVNAKLLAQAVKTANAP